MKNRDVHIQISNRPAEPSAIHKMAVCGSYTCFCCRISPSCCHFVKVTLVDDGVGLSTCVLQLLMIYCKVMLLRFVFVCHACLCMSACLFDRCLSTGLQQALLSRRASVKTLVCNVGVDAFAKFPCGCVRKGSYHCKSMGVYGRVLKNQQT